MDWNIGLWVKEVFATECWKSFSTTMAWQWRRHGNTMTYTICAGLCVSALVLFLIVVFDMAVYERQAF